MVFDASTVLTLESHYVVSKILTEADTVELHGRKELGNIIATAAFVDMIVEATVKLVDDRLPEGFLTVGRSMSFTHSEPTCLGMILSVQATLKEIKGEHLVFAIEAWDEAGRIGQGLHERSVVQLQILQERAHKRIFNKV